MGVTEAFKVLLLGIVEGITEWLPVSSTGHLILIDKFLRLDASDAFKEMFFVVIQLGAIMAVVVLYWEKLFPVSLAGKPVIKKETLSIWGKIFAASAPAAVIGILFDDKIDTLFYNYQTVSVTLIVYGILFIVIENLYKNRISRINNVTQVSYKTAVFIGLFQVLALIPGTSRSGATIIGAILMGTSKTIAAEFTFLLAVPVMLGASFLKILKFGFSFDSSEIAILLTGMFTAFLVSILSIKFLLSYIKRHNFKAFGWYRIILGIIVIFFSVCL